VTLYGLERSVYTRIARLALEEKGVSYTLHEVEIFGPSGVPVEHRARHPFGRIPAFEHGAFRLYETAAITRYVDEAFAGPPLQPREPQRRARLSQLLGVLDAYAYRPMVWGVFVERVRVPASGRSSDEGKVAAALLEAELCLNALEALIECRPYLLGPELTLADLHAFPLLKYFALAPEGEACLRGHAALMQWFEAMQMRPSVQRTRSVYEVPRLSAAPR
jgi:glutathione S-transferase